MKDMMLVCKRCGYKWLPRSMSKPNVCPRCLSCYWDINRGMEPVEDLRVGRTGTEWLDPTMEKYKPGTGREFPGTGREFIDSEEDLK